MSGSEDEAEEEELSGKTRPTELLSIADSQNSTELDSDRIVDPSSDLSLSLLYQYVPATKLKGTAHFLPIESTQYSQPKATNIFFDNIEYSETG